MTIKAGGDTSNRILLVDDEPFILASMMQMLYSAFEKIGHPKELVDKLVDKAEDGMQAFDKVKTLQTTQKQQYGLIITDLLMPKMDGFTFSFVSRNFMNGSGAP